MGETRDDLEDLAFGLFAKAHPREAYDYDPDRFWGFHQREIPGVSRQEMEARINETEYYADYAARVSKGVK